MQISPGMTHPPSRLCLSDIRRSVPCKYWALVISATSPRYAASYPLPVRQASALPSASSRFAVARDTLAVRLTLPLAGRVEDFHLQVSAPCRAHRKKRRISCDAFGVFTRLKRVVYVRTPAKATARRVADILMAVVRASGPPASHIVDTTCDRLPALRTATESRASLTSRAEFAACAATARRPPRAADRPQ
jgi:hypothetical protein